MTINGNSGYGSYSSYIQCQQSPSFDFSQFQPQSGPVQQGGGSSIASILQQVQTTAKGLEQNGESADNAFADAIQQISQQLNPALQANASSSTPTASSTASGTSGTSTTSGTSGTSTDATSTTGAQSTGIGGPPPFWGDHDSDDGSGGATSHKSMLSQLMFNQGANPSLMNFLASQGASGNSGSTAASTTVGSTTSGNSSSNLLSQLSGQTGLTTQQAGSEIDAILNSLVGSISSPAATPSTASSACSTGAASNTGTTSTATTTSATPSSTASTSSTSPTGSTTKSSADELWQLIQSMGSNSQGASQNGGYFGAWAMQNMNQNLMNSMSFTA